MGANLACESASALLKAPASDIDKYNLTDINRCLAGLSKARTRLSKVRSGSVLDASDIDVIAAVEDTSVKVGKLKDVVSLKVKSKGSRRGGAGQPGVLAVLISAKEAGIDVSTNVMSSTFDEHCRNVVNTLASEWSSKENWPNIMNSLKLITNISPTDVDCTHIALSDLISMGVPLSEAHTLQDPTSHLACASVCCNVAGVLFICELCVSYM